MLNETTSELTQGNKANMFCKKRLIFLKKCASKQVFKAK